jgi:hypothetical protein
LARPNRAGRTRLLQPVQATNPISRNPCQHNATMRNVAPVIASPVAFVRSEGSSSSSAGVGRSCGTRGTIR